MNFYGYLFSIYYLLAVVFILYPLLAEDNNSDVVKIFSIGHNKGEEIYQIAGIAVDSLGNIFISDNVDYSIKKFDKNGNLQNKIGRRGQGPGEFNYPLFMNIYNNTVALMEVQIPVIHYYKSDLEHLESIKYDNLIIDFDYNRSGDLFIAHFGKSNIYKAIGNRSEKFIELRKEPDSNSLLDAFIFVIDKNNNFIVAYRFFNIIEIYNSSGDLMTQFSISLLPEKASVSERGLPEHVLIRDIRIDHKNRIAILIGGMSDEANKTIYVFNSKGVKLGSYVLPDPSRLIKFDSMGYLYATAGFGTILRKYKVRDELIWENK